MALNLSVVKKKKLPSSKLPSYSTGLGLLCADYLNAWTAALIFREMGNDMTGDLVSKLSIERF